MIPLKRFNVLGKRFTIDFNAPFWEITKFIAIFFATKFVLHGLRVLYIALYVLMYE